MKIKIIVIVSDNREENVNSLDYHRPLEYIVSVGRGNKTFKWLSLVVAQRYALCAPNGTIRRQEASRAVSIER